MTNSKKDRTNEVAIVTGGSSGIGKEIVKILLAKNFKVFVIDKQKCNNVTKAIFLKTDLKDKKQIAQTCKTIAQKTEKIAVLINCAGIYPSVHWSEYTLKIWQDCFDVNVTAPFLLCKLLTPLLSANGSGQIINITSGAVYLGSRDPGYSASKAALTGLTKALAKNLAPNNILVNAIAPGPINTPMSQAGMRKKDVEKYLENIPLKRFGEAEEVAEVVKFLIFGKSRFQTGSTIHLNGGLYMN